MTAAATISNSNKKQQYQIGYQQQQERHINDNHDKAPGMPLRLERLPS